jgi:hypothetical protein
MQSGITRLRAALAGVLLAATATTASAQNVLVNPGFENGLAGWITFGNVYSETNNGWQFVPYEGDKLVSMFGNWSGGFNVSGMFQEFPTTEGVTWQLSAKSRHFSGDAMIGSQATGGNWVVQKIVFKDASDAELPGAVESIILDGTFATDVWHDNAPIRAKAPAGTVQIEAFILYLQPLYDGGAAHIDDVELINPMAFDLKPGSCPNPLNIADKGQLPAAILGSSVLDVHDIDASTLALNGVPVTMSRYEDVAAPDDGLEACGCPEDGPDGTMDLTLKFPSEAVSLTLVPVTRGEERELTLTGAMLDGRPFSASDCVVIVGKKPAMTGGTRDEIAPAPGSAAEEGSDQSKGGFGLSAAPSGNVQRVEYSVPEASTVRLTVYDIAGRVVRRLVDASAGAGTHTLDWNTAGMPNGVYFYRLEAAGRAATRKMVILQK